MLHCVVLVLCIVLCAGCGFPSFNFSVVNQQNKTGNWHTKVQLDHEGEQPWNMYVNYTSTKIRCSQVIDIIPNLPVAASTDESTKTTKLISPGYELMPGLGYYKVHKEFKNWDESNKTCFEEKSHLVILNSDKEAKYVGNLTLTHNLTRHDFWVGFHDQYKNGYYVTIFNETLEATGFAKWYQSFPKNWRDNKCGFFAFHSASISGYGLGNERCLAKFPFVCEQDLSHGI